ncbi:MAG: secretin N-terminal domain-containing protein [bacterium]
MRSSFSRLRQAGGRPSRRLVLVSICLTFLMSPALLGVDSATAVAASPSAQAPVTLSAQNEDILDLLSLFSRTRGINIVTSGEVEGTVSIELNAVPFEEALQAVVAMTGFQVVKRGNIYYIQQSPGEESNQAFLHNVQTFRLDYAKPDDVLPVITQLLSENGRASSYPPLRSLVVEDMPEVLQNVSSVISSLDVSPRQVIIEAKIMEARMSRDANIGIDWASLFDGSNGDVTVAGFASPAGVSSEGLFVTWGQGDFTAALQALKTVDKLETVASPRLLAIDGSEAEIIIGGQLGFSVVTTVENTVIQSVQFLDTGTQLRITPFITQDGFILMKIHPELSDGVVQEGLPSKTTTEVSTDVLIKDGQTLLIGGLIRERDELSRKGIPLLMDIPVLGYLFGVTRTSVQKSEVIVLITPRILQPGEVVDD